MVRDSIEWNNEQKSLIFHVNIVHEDENSLTCIAASLLSLVHQYVNDGGKWNLAVENNDVWEKSSQEEEPDAKMEQPTEIELHLLSPWFFLMYAVIDIPNPTIFVDP